MGIDIYYYSKHSNPKNEDYIWTIDDDAFFQFSDCFELYKKRTGKIVDEYGDLDLQTGTLEPLLKCVHEILKKTSTKGKTETLKKLEMILLKAIELNKGIGLYGD